MILPDGSDSQDSRPKTGRAVLFVVAALVIVLGFLAMGSLSPAERVAIQTTTTTGATTTTSTTTTTTTIDLETFTITQIATGEPLVWGLTMAIDDGYPVALLNHEDWLYLFSTPAPFFTDPQEGGLGAWRSTDGVNWEALGQVIAPEHVITTVTATGQGLIALEFRRDTTGFTVWESADAITWTPERVDFHAGSEFAVAFPQAAGGNDQIIVVATGVALDVPRLLEMRVGEEFGLSYPAGWRTQGTVDDLRFELWGPLGFSLATITGEEAGLTDRERELVIGLDDRGPTSHLWIRDQAGWRRSETPDLSTVYTMTTSLSGEILVFGDGPTGFTTWSTTNGSVWRSLRTPFGPNHADWWRDTLIGPARTGGPSLLIMQPDGSWVDTGLSQHFPSRIQWGIGQVASGSGGIAAILYGWTRSGEPALPVEPTTLHDGEATLRLDFGTGSYTLEKDGEVHIWRAGATPEGIGFDLQTGDILFHDPDTGNLLASFPLAEVNRAGDEFWSTTQFETPHEALAFTPDGAEWTVQDLGPLDTSDFQLIEVTGSHVVAAGNGSRFTPNPPPGFEVWSAPIP